MYSCIWSLLSTPDSRVAGKNAGNDVLTTATQQRCVPVPGKRTIFWKGHTGISNSPSTFPTGLTTDNYFWNTGKMPALTSHSGVTLLYYCSNTPPWQLHPTSLTACPAHQCWQLESKITCNAVLTSHLYTQLLQGVKPAALKQQTKSCPCCKPAPCSHYWFLRTCNPTPPAGQCSKHPPMDLLELLKSS